MFLKSMNAGKNSLRSVTKVRNLLLKGKGRGETDFWFCGCFLIFFAFTIRLSILLYLFNIVYDFIG